MEWAKAIEAAKAGKPRNFVQTWDLIINLKGLDLKKPENRFSTELVLPEGLGRPLRVAVIADNLAKDAKEAGADLVIRKEEIAELAADKKRLKKLVESYDWFLAEASLMAAIAKSWGVVLGPRGKMPKPVPPNVALKPLIEATRRSIRIVLRESPVVAVAIGNQSMSDQAIARNAEAVYNLVKDRLPRGAANIKSVLLKLTMGRPVKV